MSARRALEHASVPPLGSSDSWTARSETGRPGGARSPREDVGAIATWIDHAHFRVRAARRHAGTWTAMSRSMSNREAAFIGEIGFVPLAAERAARLGVR